ncbi:NB-ARC domain-containing protein [Abeliophyllum distichum]|uniref:NB-ARC domain-containing protein n=1 Tax=Abeliophyllum distichum TaxID=126358 RepID=A0ABD1RVY0_9LAMI
MGRRSSPSKCLEDVALEYLLELVDRNLILVHEKSSIGKIKTFRIYDLLRDFCVREGQREKFFHVNIIGLCGISEGTKVRRLGIHSDRKPNDLDNCLQNMRLQSVLNFDWEYYHQSDKLINSRLLSVFDTNYTSINEFPVNLQYFACNNDMARSLPVSLRNLQTFICWNEISEIVEIWEMRQLRHVNFCKMVLPVPPSAETEGKNSIIVLDNLQTHCRVVNLRCIEEVLQRIPNLKKLEISFPSGDVFDGGYYCLNNLVHLLKLESLDMTIVGSLPNLQVLKLLKNSFVGLEWEPNDGEFLQLKYLGFNRTNLENWIADSIHFPSLEHLVIEYCESLEIPSCIGEIPTLESIELSS